MKRSILRPSKGCKEAFRYFNQRSHPFEGTGFIIKNHSNSLGDFSIDSGLGLMLAITLRAWLTDLAQQLVLGGDQHPKNPYKNHPKHPETTEGLMKHLPETSLLLKTPKMTDKITTCIEAQSAQNLHLPSGKPRKKNKRPKNTKPQVVGGPLAFLKSPEVKAKKSPEVNAKPSETPKRRHRTAKPPNRCCRSVWCASSALRPMPKRKAVTWQKRREGRAKKKL